MAFPTDEELAKNLLDLLARTGGSAKTDDIAEGLAKRLKLTDADLNQRIRHAGRPGGESAWRQRLRRVRHYLVKRGKLESGTARGVWVLAKE
jgi:hypothetical protein